MNNFYQRGNYLKEFLTVVFVVAVGFFAYKAVNLGTEGIECAIFKCERELRKEHAEQKVLIEALQEEIKNSNRVCEASKENIREGSKQIVAMCEENMRINNTYNKGVVAVMAAIAERDAEEENLNKDTTQSLSSDTHSEELNLETTEAMASAPSFKGNKTVTFSKAESPQEIKRDLKVAEIQIESLWEIHCESKFTNCGA